MIKEEIGRHGLVTGQVAIQGQRWLLDWGTDEQKDRWLRGIATGELVFSESISEKNAGSSFKTHGGHRHPRRRRTGSSTATRPT